MPPHNWPKMRGSVSNCKIVKIFTPLGVMLRPALSDSKVDFAWIATDFYPTVGTCLRGAFLLRRFLLLFAAVSSWSHVHCVVPTFPPIFSRPKKSESNDVFLPL